MGRSFLSAKALKAVQGFHFVTERSMLVSFHVRSVALWQLEGIQCSALETIITPRTTLDIETKGVPISCAFDSNRFQLVVVTHAGTFPFLIYHPWMNRRGIHKSKPRRFYLGFTRRSMSPRFGYWEIEFCLRAMMVVYVHRIELNPHCRKAFLSQYQL